MSQTLTKIEKTLRLGALNVILVAASTTVAAAELPRNKEKALLSRLAESQQQIRGLQQQINTLERRLNALAAPGIPASQAESPASGSNMPSLEAKAPESSPVRTATAAESVQAPVPGQSGEAGSFIVDEAAAQRALERTLVQTGALLLPPATYEVTPVLSYSLLERTTAVLGTVSSPGSSAPSPAIVPQRVRTTETSLALNVRAGLGGDLQAEAHFPFSHLHGLRTNDFGNAQSASGNGRGDISVGLAKTFLREVRWRPDIVGRLTYQFRNGRRQEDLLAFGGGFRQLQGELVALKRQDPLGFTASVFYSRVFERDAFKPGDVASYSLGAALAASPATSLQLNFTQIWRKRQQTAGVKVAGTDQTYGIVAIGATSVLSRDVTLVTQFGIGLGSDAPKYSANFSLPFLFRQ